MEFAGLLQAEEDIITEVLILPGTESSRMSALIRLYMLPNMQVVGSAHSHPSSDPQALQAGHSVLLSHRRLPHHSRPALRSVELGLLQCWKAVRRELPILDVDFKDDGFDDDLDDEFD